MTAVEYLESIGQHVEQSDIPGLLIVDGQELTLGQVRSLADQLAYSEFLEKRFLWNLPTPNR